LLQQVVGHLRVARHLLGVSAYQKETKRRHCYISNF
jgi:hypothetical protein